MTRMCHPACEIEDQEEEAILVSLGDGTTAPGEEDVRIMPLTASCVKMKLASFLRDKDRVRLSSALNGIVYTGNRLLGEAYAFSNFHVSRLLNAGATPIRKGHAATPANLVLPVMDRNFFYRCLLAVSVSNARKTTLGADFQVSVDLFDGLRPTDTPKVDIRDLNQLVASLSIIMATMATNHLWMNLHARVSRYVKWRYSYLKKGWRLKIASATTHTRTVDLTTLFPTHGADPMAARAMAAAAELRLMLPETTCHQFANRAHLTLPMYHHILKETELENILRKCLPVQEPACKCRLLRTFTLLPIKSAFTLSYIPISSMMWVQLLKKMKLEPMILGDGRSANHRCLWAKYCNLSSVETHTRKFDRQIVTDGYGVSVLMTGRSAPRCSVPDLQPHPLMPDHPVITGVDPGMSDYVTVASNHGKTWKCSAAEFMDRAGMLKSGRTTARFNAELAQVASTIPTPNTTDPVCQRTYLGTYLRVLPELLSHRGSRGYRKMRFMRFCRRKQTVSWLCSKLAPPDEPCVVIGFGDWSGGHQSPISRRCAAPLKDIKFELQQRDNVILGHVPERLTSRVCHCCHERLCNMKAPSTVWRRVEGETKKRKVVVHGSVHKVLHCKNSVERSSGRCGTTWNRDVNAAKNILMLATLMIWGQERPAAFTSANIAVRRSKGDGAIPKSTQPKKRCTLIDPTRDTGDQKSQTF